MKQLLLISLLLKVLFCNATDYWSISTTTWSNTDGGADCSCSPGDLTTGDNVYVKHFISTPVMTLSGMPTVTIYNGGRWDLTGGDMDINAGSWTINSGGVLAVKGGMLTTGGFTVFEVNGKLEVTDMINNGAITGLGILSYSSSLVNNLTIDPLSALPVELVNFTVSLNANSVAVKWSTASEINSDYYTVMRSPDAVFFESIAKIEAAENSTSIVNYNYSDQSPLHGINYYQLIETDRDGRTQKSKVFAVDFSVKSNALQSYPNPVIDNATILFTSSKKGVYQFKISNAGGQIIYSDSVYMMAGENKLPVSMGDYPNGFYLLTFTDSELVSCSTQMAKK
jgi:hypothetical protein